MWGFFLTQPKSTRRRNEISLAGVIQKDEVSPGPVLPSGI